MGKKSSKNIERGPLERYNPTVEIGLSQDEINSRIENGYVNVVESHSNSILSIVLRNLLTFFNMMYIAIFILLVSANVPISNYLFVLIVLSNLAIGTFLEIKSKLTIDKLKLLSESPTKVIRNGKEHDIKKEELVIDDIVILSAGKEIASDMILVEGEIEVNESQLTGESISIHKNIGDMLYSGSVVISGNCYAKVERVGADNEIEKLSQQAKSYRKPRSEIFNSLNMLLRLVAIVIIPIGVTIFLITYRSLDIDLATGHSYTAFQKYSISIEKTSGALLGMIPSGLYLLTSTALAVGVLRLSNRNKTLVHDIYCIEMLARVDVLCLDKTGTITDGSMAVTRYTEEQKHGEYNIEEIIASMNSALNEQNFTAKALENYFGFNKKLTPIITCPFTSENKYSAVTFEDKGTFIIGAPEFVLRNGYAKIEDSVNEYANQGLRVLALAHSTSPIKDGKIQKNPKLVSLILIEDKIRSDAVDTIRYFKENDVEIKIISGDNPLTVAEVAKRVGVENAENAISLDGLTDAEVYELANKYTVFGRVKPNQKKILVKALKDAKHTVAMTGDGVNDILALREADCSIAMASGCDAVKNVAQLVLLDSNFNAMPKIVAEGRRVINNIQQTSMLFLVKTLFIMILSFLFVIGFMKKFGPIGGVNSFPISPSQLTLIELFAIGIPAFFLALQPNYQKIQGHFISNVIRRALPGALAVAFEVMLTYVLSKALGLSTLEVTTIVVIVATATCMLILFMACKPFSIKKSLMYIVLAFCCVFIVFMSTSGKQFWGINFQEQFKLYGLIKDDKKEVSHSINTAPGELMNIVDDEEGIYSYKFAIPKSLPNGVAIKVLFSNGIVNYAYAENLAMDENNFFNPNHTEGDESHWTRYDDSDSSVEGVYTIYYKNTENWRNVYAYLFYTTTDEVIDATPLLLAFSLSEASYIINFVFNSFFTNFFEKNDEIKRKAKEKKHKLES